MLNLWNKNRICADTINNVKWMRGRCKGIFVKSGIKCWRCKRYQENKKNLPRNRCKAVAWFAVIQLIKFMRATVSWFSKPSISLESFYNKIISLLRGKDDKISVGDIEAASCLLHFIFMSTVTILSRLMREAQRKTKSHCFASIFDSKHKNPSQAHKGPRQKILITLARWLNNARGREENCLLYDNVDRFKFFYLNILRFCLFKFLTKHCTQRRQRSKGKFMCILCYWKIKGNRPKHQ